MLNYEIFVRDRYSPKAYFKTLEGTNLLDYHSNPIFLYRLKSLPREGLYRVSRPYRPDLVAQEVWGVPRLFWSLLLYGDLKVSDFQEDVEVPYFALSEFDRMVSDLALEYRRLRRS